MLPSISGISDTPEYKENGTVQKFSNAVDVITDAMEKGTAIGYEHGAKHSGRFSYFSGNH